MLRRTKLTLPVFLNVSSGFSLQTAETLVSLVRLFCIVDSNCCFLPLKVAADLKILNWKWTCRCTNNAAMSGGAVSIYNKERNELFS